MTKLTVMALAGLVTLYVIGYNVFDIKKVPAVVSCQAYGQDPPITRCNPKNDSLLFANFKCTARSTVEPKTTIEAFVEAATPKQYRGLSSVNGLAVKIFPSVSSGTYNMNAIGLPEEIGQMVHLWVRER